MELKDIALIAAGVAGVAGIGYAVANNDTDFGTFTDFVNDNIPDVDDDKCWCVLVDEAWKCTCDIVNDAGDVIGFEDADFFKDDISFL